MTLKEELRARRNKAMEIQGIRNKIKNILIQQQDEKPCNLSFNFEVELLENGEIVKIDGEKIAWNMETLVKFLESEGLSWVPEESRFYLDF